MNTNSIYQKLMETIDVSIANHTCPDGRANLLAFCQTYKFNRPHLCQQLKGTARQDMSLGVFLRLVTTLGLCLPGVNKTEHAHMSLRQYLSINHDAVQRTVLQLAFAE